MNHNDQPKNEPDTLIRIIVLSNNLVAQAVAADIVEQAFRQRNFQHVEHRENGFGVQVQRSYYKNDPAGAIPVPVDEMLHAIAPSMLAAPVIVDDFFQGELPPASSVSPSGVLTHDDEMHYRYRELQKSLNQYGYGATMTVTSE